MGVIDRCRFDTEHLEVLPWHDALGDDDLAGFVAGLLTAEVTAALPTDWQGRYDAERAAAWVRARDGESTVLLAIDRSAPVGLLIISGEGEAPTHDVRIGYLLNEASWGRGFATELIGGFVAWCRSFGAVRSVTAGVESTNAASVRALEHHDFSPTDTTSSGEQSYRLEFDDVTVRPETPADHEAIRRVVTDAFGSPAEADLVERIRSSPEYVHDLALVAEIDGAVVGHVMVSGAVVRHDGTERAIVMLSPLAVATGRQRRGVGARLVVAALDGAERHSEPLVVLEGDPAYYARFGFEHSVAHGLSLPLPGWAPTEAGQVALLVGYDPTDETLRGDVVYPVAFDGLD